jgi:competence protein ComEC
MKMSVALLLCATCLGSGSVGWGQGRPARTVSEARSTPTRPRATSVGAFTRPGDLHVWFVDVEGGQATLFVTPQGTSLLIDTGWENHNGRDADRIAAAARAAGLQRIDFVLITHYHEDHVGGVPQLAQRIPVGTYFDHGDLYERVDVNQQIFGAYLQELERSHSHRISVHAGDRLPIPGMDVLALSSDGKVINRDLPGGGAVNRYCAQEPMPREDRTENGHSLGVMITFAGTRILDLGDLTKDRERMLMCPTNRIGGVDIDIVSHHGWEQSSSAALVHAIQPRVAIMDNGATKGGSVPVLDVYRSSPGLETLWQLHTSEEGRKAGPKENTAEPFIANPPGVDGNMIELVVHSNGSFAVRNDRTGTVKVYGPK